MSTFTAEFGMVFRYRMPFGRKDVDNQDKPKLDLLKNCTKFNYLRRTGSAVVKTSQTRLIRT